MLIISAGARSDLKEIWAYAAEYDVDSANKIIRELARKFELLEANPKIGRTKNGLIVEMRLFPHKNYQIYYFPIENGIEIYRVLHTKRDIEDLFEDFFEGLKQ